MLIVLLCAAILLSIILAAVAGFMFGIVLALHLEAVK